MQLPPTSFPLPCPGITAMVPCYNEVQSIDRAYWEIRAELTRYDNVEILFVDDGSTDGTLDRIKVFAANDLLVKYVSFTRNFGLEAAFSAGFTYASKPWTVQFDADLQSPPEELHRLIDKALEGYDAVFAIRDRRRDPWYRRLGSGAHQAIATRMLGIELPTGASVFRIVRTSVAQKVVEHRVSTPYFIATVPLLGARYTTLRTKHRARQAGRTKWTLPQLFGHAVELFVGFSFRPLTVMFGIAALTAMAGLVAVSLALAGVAGSLSVAMAGLATGLVTLALLTLVARYLIRVLRVQALGVPRYQIRECNIPVRVEDALYGVEMRARNTLVREQVG